MIDPLLLKHGVKIVTDDGERLVVSGSYMSEGGIVVCAKRNSGDLCEMNVPFRKIASVEAEKETVDGTGT